MLYNGFTEESVLFFVVFATDLEHQEEAISINDIMIDLQEVLMSEELPETDLSMKYLFIDEFQDSDLSQIKVACLLSRILGAVCWIPAI